MIDMTDKDYVKALKANMHVVFESPQGKEVMEFLEQIGSWYPKYTDTLDTNEVIARDANRRLLGTIKSILNLSAEQIVSVSTQWVGR